MHPEVFQGGCHIWGMLDVDLLAIRFNSKLDRFVSRSTDQLTEVVDALVAPWDQYTLNLCLCSPKTSYSSDPHSSDPH